MKSEKNDKNTLNNNICALFTAAFFGRTQTADRDFRHHVGEGIEPPNFSRIVLTLNLNRRGLFCFIYCVGGWTWWKPRSIDAADCPPTHAIPAWRCVTTVAGRLVRRCSTDRRGFRRLLDGGPVLLREMFSDRRPVRPVTVRFLRSDGSSHSNTGNCLLL